LYFGALTAGAGILTGFDEPDLLCEVSDIEYGVAVKRIKSAKKFETNVRDAADQVERSEIAGIIALDISIPLNPDHRPHMKIEPDEHFDRERNRRMDEFIESFQPNLEEWTRPKGVRAVVMVDHRPRLRGPAAWGLDTRHTFLLTAGGNQRRNREALAFRDAYKRGVARCDEIRTRAV